MKTIAPELVILIDENDTAIGTEEKLKAHQLGLLHRAFSVCILKKKDGEWYLLLQQRALGKYHSSGLWTNTCCSHPRPSESTKEAAERRLKEEMGITADLNPIGSFIYRAELDNELIEYELDYVLIGETDSEEIYYNATEVMAYRWMELSLLISQIEQKPKLYTAWLMQVVQLVKKHLCVA